MANPAKKLAVVQKRVREAAPKVEVVKDSETAIRLEKDALAERLKRLKPKQERAGQIVATDAQDLILNTAGNIDTEIGDLNKKIEALKAERNVLLAPLCNELDNRGKYELTGTKFKLRAEAYEASVSLKMPGYTHRLRER